MWTMKVAEPEQAAIWGVRSGILPLHHAVDLSAFTLPQETPQSTGKEYRELI